MKRRAREKIGRVESQKGEDQRWRKSEKRRRRCAKRVGKSCETVLFPVLRGSGGSKSRLAKAAGAEVEHVGRGPLLDVPISKTYKPLRRQAYLQ